MLERNGGCAHPLIFMVAFLKPLQYGRKLCHQSRLFRVFREDRIAFFRRNVDNLVGGSQHCRQWTSEVTANLPG